MYAHVYVRLFVVCMCDVYGVGDCRYMYVCVFMMHVHMM